MDRPARCRSVLGARAVRGSGVYLRCFRRHVREGDHPRGTNSAYAGHLGLGKSIPFRHPVGSGSQSLRGGILVPSSSLASSPAASAADHVHHLAVPLAPHARHRGRENLLPADCPGGVPQHADLALRGATRLLLVQLALHRLLQGAARPQIVVDTFLPYEARKCLQAHRVAGELAHGRREARGHVELRRRGGSSIGSSSLWCSSVR